MVEKNEISASAATEIDKNLQSKIELVSHSYIDFLENVLKNKESLDVEIIYALNDSNRILSHIIKMIEKTNGQDIQERIEQVSNSYIDFLNDSLKNPDQINISTIYAINELFRTMHHVIQTNHYSSSHS